MLEQIGNWGYQLGALGILAFTVAYLVVVRWWTDVLGRVIAGVFSSATGVLVLSTIRMIIGPENNSTTLLVWRLVVFWVFGSSVWAGIVAFLWSQFFASRMKLQTRKAFNDEEVDVADRGPRGDDDSHRHSGSDAG